MAENVRVICRFRPTNEREEREFAARESSLKLTFPDPRTVVVQLGNAPPQVFTFDSVFDMKATQQLVYEQSACTSIQAVLEGYNATIFAYGQTGAGKTFTMLGPGMRGDEQLWGIIPRASRHIFQAINEDTAGTEFTIRCSYLEIYKEQVNDLFDIRKKGLKVHESPARGVYVEGLTEEIITCEEDIIDLLAIGGENRAVSATDMNAVSSRSHSLFIIYIHQKNMDGATATGKLNLVDLAGSEKVGKTGATGNTLEEAKKINQSLSALGNCIHALTESNRGHVPFRDSKLTRILQESLGGNTKTTLLCALSPHQFNIEETLSTLKFAQRAKTIKNVARVNAQKSAAELERIIDNLKREIAELKRYCKSLEDTIAWMKSPDYKPGDPSPYAVSRPEIMAQKATAMPGSAAAAAAASSGSSVTSPGPDSLRRSLSGPGDSFADVDGGLAEKLVDLEKARAAADNLAETMRDELETLRSQLAEREERERESTAKVERATRDLEAMAAERADWDTARQQLKFEADEYKLDLETAVEELNTVQARADQLVAELSAAQAERDRVVLEVESLRRESAMAAEELSSGRTAAEEARRARAAAESQLSQLEEETASLRQKTEELELENEDLHEFVAQVEAEKEQIESEMSELQAQIKLKSQQFDALESSLKAAQARAGEFESQVALVESQRRTRVGQLEAEIKTLKQAQHDGEESVRQLRQKIKQAENDAAVHGETLLSLKQANADLESSLSQLQQSNAALRRQVGEASVSAADSAMHEEIERMSARIKAQQAEHASELRSLQESHQQSRDELQLVLDQTRRQRDELQQRLESEVVALQASLARAEDNARAATARAQSSADEMEGLTQDNRRLSESLQQTKLQLDKLTIEKQQGDSRLQSEESRHAAVVKKFEELSEEHSLLKKAHTELKQKSDDAARESATRVVDTRREQELTADNEALRGQLLSTQAELRTVREQSEKAVADAALEATKTKSLARKMQQQSERLSEVDRQLRDAVDAARASSSELEDVRRKYDALLKEVEELRSSKQALQLEVDQQRNRTERQSRVVRPLRAANNSIISAAYAYKEDFEAVRRGLRQTNSSVLDAVRAEAARAKAVAEEVARRSTTNSPASLPPTPSRP